MNAERIGNEMDAARMAQDQANMAARAAGMPAHSSRNEFLFNANVQTAFAENVIAPIAGSILAEATSGHSQHGMDRLESVMQLTPAETAAYSQSIQAKIAGLPADATKGQISQALETDEAWFHDRFMRSEDGRPATRLDQVLASLEDRDVVPGMSDHQWDIMNNSVDYAAGLSGALRSVNEGVNRKMTVATDNAELFAQDPATLSPADRQRLEGIIMRTDISAAEFAVMQKAARVEVRRTQGADVTPETTINARTQAQVDSLRQELLEANRTGDTTQVDRLQQEIQRVLAANVASRRRAQNVGDMHDTASIDARHQAQITALEGKIQAATNRGDTLLANQLQQQLDSAQQRYEGTRYQHLNILREQLTAQQLKRLNGGEAARSQVDLNALATNTPPPPGSNLNNDPRDPNITPDLIQEAYDTNRDMDMQALAQSTDRYAIVSARQRNSHIGRIEGNGLRGFLKNSLWKGMTRKELEQSVALDAEVAQARAEHDANRDRLAANILSQNIAEGRTEGEVRVALLTVGLDDLRNLESSIARFGAQQANAAPRARLASWLAQRGRLIRGAIVAGPAGAAGVAAGAATGVTLGVLGAPALAVIGAGIAGGVALGYAGRRFGRNVTTLVNRGRALADQKNGYERAREGLREAREAYRADANARVGAPDEFGTFLNPTTYVERQTRTQVHENQNRRAVAGIVGGLAAGIGFSIGTSLGLNAFNSAGSEATFQQGQAPTTGAEAQPTPPAIPDGVDPTKYPWTVAHNMTPGSEFGSINHAMDIINQTTGSHLHLQPVGGHVEVFNGVHPLSQIQQEAFNRAMIQIVQTGKIIG